MTSEKRQTLFELVLALFMGLGFVNLAQSNWSSSHNRGTKAFCICENLAHV